MAQKPLTVSIIIPVYNEEHHIRRCLEAVKYQTVLPKEVIVVDNNCTDKTVEIAKQFPFVRVVRETRQGHAPARNAGFDTATTDLIGRIDADSIINKNWVERLLNDFQDPDLAAVTGLGRTDFIPRVHTKIKSTFWCRIYYWNVHAYYNTVTTWGANMAVRRNFWDQVRPKVSDSDDQTHEDQDIGLLIAGAGGKIIQDNKLLISTAGQTYLYFPKIVHYAWLQHLTKKHHKQIGTFESPDFRGLGFFRTLPGRLGGLLPGIVFFVTSFLFWPLDSVMIDILGRSKWLRR